MENNAQPSQHTPLPQPSDTHTANNNNNLNTTAATKQPDSPPPEKARSIEPRSSTRVPLAGLSLNRTGLSLPSTPMGLQMKTPEVDALLSAALRSPLSLSRALIDGEARPAGASGPSASEMSPLLQLASLMERTPRMPVSRLGDGGGGPPSDPEDLKHALLNSSLMASPTETPEQLRELRAVLRNIDKTFTDKKSMPPPSSVPRMDVSASEVREVNTRKRNLEEALSGSEDVGRSMFDSIDEVVLAGDDFSLADLMDVQNINPAHPGLLDPPAGGGGGSRKRASLGGSKRGKRQEKNLGKPTKCRCDKSGCLKRYCVCFAAGGICGPDCVCKGCENNESTAELKSARQEAIQKMISKKNNAFQSRFGEVTGDDGEAEAVHLTGCNCKKSACKKRYCECYQAGVKCTSKCKCCNCDNPHGINESCKQLSLSTTTPMTTQQPRLAHDSTIPTAPAVIQLGDELSLAAARALPASKAEVPADVGQYLEGDVVDEQWPPSAEVKRKLLSTVSPGDEPSAENRVRELRDAPKSPVEVASGGLGGPDKLVGGSADVAVEADAPALRGQRRTTFAAELTTTIA